MPGYSGDYDADGDMSWLGDDLSAGFGWGDDDPSASAWPGGVAGGRGQGRPTASNAVRGFPPAPGEPLPVYPPGPFEAWNRGPARAVAPTTGEFPRVGADADVSQLKSATITPDDFDTDYSLPAIKDPALGAAVANSGRTALTGTSAAARPGPGAGRTTQNSLPGEPVKRGPAVGDAVTGAQPAAGGPATRMAARQASRPGHAGKRGQASTDLASGGAPRGRAAKGGAAPSRAGRTRSGRKRHSHWPAILTAVVIILAVAGVLVYSLPRHSSPSPPQNPKPASSPSPTATGPTTPPGQWGFIGTRKTDPTPLTMAEVFPATISDGATSYTRAKQVIGKDCHASVIGSALQAAIRKAGCSQALRATYLSKAAKVMATIGVFNLKNAAQAGKAAAKAGRSEFVTQLPAKAGPAKAIGQGTGLEEALVKGHYLVLVWAEPTNVSASPSGKSKTKLDAFMNLLVAHTVNVSLSYRMVDGKPPPAG